MPRLSVSLDGLPAQLYAGELLRLPVTITNAGRLPARSLRLAVADGAGVALVGGGAAAAAGGAAAVLEGERRGAGGAVRQRCMSPRSRHLAKRT
jgi:hypothetical protein